MFEAPVGVSGDEEDAPCRREDEEDEEKGGRDYQPKDSVEAIPVVQGRSSWLKPARIPRVSFFVLDQVLYAPDVFVLKV